MGPGVAVLKPDQSDNRDMDTTSIMISVLFGIVGMGMFMYGKKAGRMVPLGAGVGLMVVPYFIPNVIILSLVCCGLTASPWILRDS
jgi:hypothetical protein